jgi:hypothetical protein
MTVSSIRVFAQWIVVLSCDEISFLFFQIILCFFKNIDIFARKLPDKHDFRSKYYRKFANRG